ncbi:FHA domain-containing protein [Lentzea sp. NPDC058450]|uniref:FHA domain-containing protein n=1 Tax=Lentzea sp. NPDC058450 TaxID=3346505 RepID=UPI00365434FB
MATLTYRCPDDPDGCPVSVSPGFCAVHPATMLEPVRAAAFSGTQTTAEAPAEPPAGSPLTLRFLGQVIEVPAEGMEIGRETGPLASVPGMAELTQVSRLHARIHLLNGHLYVSDEDSLNHTYVDGRRLTTSRRLEAGQVLRLGQDVELHVEGARYDEFGLPS